MTPGTKHDRKQFTEFCWACFYAAAFGTLAITVCILNGWLL